MNLLQSLPLDESNDVPVVAFVGAGGKTSAMFQLAAQLLEADRRTVIVTTTTHLADSEIERANTVLQMSAETQFNAPESGLPNGLVVVCGDSTGDGRVQSLSEENLERVYTTACENRIPLLIEADGSRRKPIKAPDLHEPAIPSFTNIVVVVVGLSGLGKVINENTIHRLAQFCQITGRSTGEKIQPNDVVTLLNHPNGGLKNIPGSAKRIVLLNQVDCLESNVTAHDIAFQTRSHYDQIVIAGVRSMPEIYASHGRIAGIILAAGSSSRLNRPKQLLAWRGRTLLEHVIRIAGESGLNPISLVLGANEGQIRASLASSMILNRYSVNIISNPDWAEGQSSSVRESIRELEEHIDGCVFLLADQPLIQPDLVKRLQIKRAESRAWVVIPRYKGERANPVLFGKELFNQLTRIKGDRGGRAILKEANAFPVSWVDTDDRGTVFDVDTEADYHQLIGWKIL